MNKGFCEGKYAIGIDYGSSTDEGVIAIVKLGDDGKPDELVASLTWEQARLVARAVREADGNDA
jgi:hypothetical protein